MYKFKCNFNTRLHRVNVSLLAITSFICLVPALGPWAAMFLSSGFILTGFNIITLPFGILGDGAPFDEKALLAKVKKEAQNAILNEFTNLLEGQQSIKDIRAVLKKLEDAKSADEIIAMKQEIKGFSDSVLKLKAKLERKKKSGIEKHDLVSLFIKGLRKFKPEQLQALKNDSRGELRVVTFKGQEVGNRLVRATKAADVPMSESVSVVPIGTGIPFELTQFEPGLTRVSRRQPFILELVNLAKTLSRYVAWVEQTTIYPGTAQTTNEGGASVDASFRWTENSVEAQKITNDVKVTKEMLDDLALVENEIRTELMELITLKLDQQVLNGSGNAPDLKGILQYAQAFSNFGGLSVVAPNNYDVLIAAILQIQANGTTGGMGAGAEMINIFNPTDIVLHPVDYTQMILAKDSLNRYLQEFYPDLAVGGKMLENCRITKNVGMTQGKFLVMDATKSNVRIREDASIALGYENQDFRNGLVMIRGELRAAHYIKSNHVNAFVSDSFANGKQAIQAV